MRGRSQQALRNNKMEIAKLILEYLKVLAWPVTVIGILIGYRKHISNLFERTKKLELPGGISLEVSSKNSRSKAISKES